jgi:hypothetical protein
MLCAHAAWPHEPLFCRSSSPSRSPSRSPPREPKKEDGPKRQGETKQGKEKGDVEMRNADQKGRGEPKSKGKENEDARRKVSLELPRCF